MAKSEAGEAEATQAEAPAEAVISTAMQYRRDFMRRVTSVEPPAALEALRRYLVPLFDPASCCIAAAAPLADHETVAATLNAFSNSGMVPSGPHIYIYIYIYIHIFLFFCYCFW
jgi:hypothetical protein